MQKGGYLGWFILSVCGWDIFIVYISNGYIELNFSKYYIVIICKLLLEYIYNSNRI